jgi:hypothetical protein
MAAAVGLRCIGLDHLPGINGDEAVFAVHAREWLAGTPFSELRGGSNRLMDPAFFGVVVSIQSWLPATLWSLRLAALVHSLLAIGLAFLLFRRRGVTFAALLAALLAVMPIQLGYARLAWDPTAVPTVMVLALAAATRRRLVLTLLAFGLCLWTHPTTVFAAPILIAPTVAAHWPRHPDGALRRPSPRALMFTGLCLAVALTLTYALVTKDALPTSVATALRGLPARILERLTSPAEALRFALLYAEFITGPTIYRYVTGSMPAFAAWLHVAGGVALFAAVVVPGLRRLPAATTSMDLAIAVGLFLSLVTAYLVGGSMVLEPQTERYGMFLVVPTCYVLTTCIEAFATSPRRAAFARAAAAAGGAVLLASFVAHFLVPLHRADPARHDTYRAGDVDPKQGAITEILARRTQPGVTVIEAQDWWIYWPLRYLAGARPDLHITIAGRRPGRPFPRDFELARRKLEGAEVFGVAWAGSRQDAKFAQRAIEHFDIGGYEPGPILRVHKLRDRAPAPVSIERQPMDGP